jgi:hypothetical protein
MGRSTTPAYRVEVTKANFNGSNFGYGPDERKYFGKPSLEALEQFVTVYNKSFLPGGTNDHCNIGGKICQIKVARLVRQRDDKVIAEYKVPH